MLRAAVFVVSVACLAPGCATPPAPVLSDQAVVLELPVVRQDELWECGLVSITALTAYYGVDMPPDMRAALAEAALENEGLSGGELREALERLGLEVYLFPGTLAEGPTAVYDQVDRGRPPLVMTSSDGEHHHYCLVLGYDPPPGHVVLLDPRRGRVVLPEEVFEQAWERSNRFTLLAVPLETEAAAEQASAPLEEE